MERINAYATPACLHMHALHGSRHFLLVEELV